MISVSTDKWMLCVKEDNTYIVVHNGALFNKEGYVSFYSFDTEEELLQYVSDNGLTPQQ